MKHTWKKAAAFVLATVLVVGIAPANVGTGGFFGQTGIVAHAASSTVTLNTNGGTINSGNITSYSEGTGAILPTDVTKEGYAFEGWFTNANFTGLPVTEISAEDTGDKTYYAKWTFYVRMGSYNGYDVDWFCVKTNTNGSMMMSKYVLKASRFGANGTYSTSDIHSWLDIDSGGTFATDLGLTASELALVKTIDSSSTYGDGTDQFTIPTLDGLDGLRSLYYTKAGVISNPSSIASIYWLRTMRDSGSARVVRSSMDTVSAGYSGATYGGRYIRPMFYLDETTMRSMIVGGSGTEDNPYILEQRYDISTNITPTNGGTVSATASRGGSEIYSGKLPNKMVAGANVTLTPSSAVGYNFKSINVNDGNVDVTDNLDGTYSFNMPDNAVTVNAVFEAIAFSNASVTLGDDLALNFYVDGIADDTAAAEYTVNFTGACVDESSALTYNAAVGKYYATTHVYAKDIDKDITATLCKGSDTVDTIEDYSITQYLSSPAFSGADEKTSALITATKDFGNASSEYFYGTGSGYSDGFASYDPDTSAYAATFDSDAAKLSLVLDSKTAARLYVKGDESGTESTISSTKADYPTYHEVTGLLPQNLADEQTINVGGTDYKFSALSWCNRVLTNGSASQKNVNMAKAIMAYYTAAKNYSSVDVSSVTITNAPTEALFVNSTGTLTATVSPNNATDKTVVWSSSDPDYVSINAETGEYTVMGKKGYGSATITATATNGTEDTSDDVTATCTITGKVTYTSLSVGTVLHTGDTFYTGSTVYFQGSTAASFTANMGVITIIEATKSGYNNKYYQCQRGSNGTYPNWSYVVKDNTDGIYITGGSGKSNDKFTLAVHTK